MFDPRTITRYDVLRLGWRITGLLVLVMASATGSYVAMAAVVSLQPPDNGVLLRIPVLLEGEDEESMAGVQFDLQFDPADYTLEGIEAGAIATDAGKETILSEPTPGTGRVLITGFNNHTLADGHVATLILRRRAPDATDEALAIGKFLATDPFGNQVPLGYRDDYSYPPVAPEPVEARLTETDGDGDTPPVTDESNDAEESTGRNAETSENSIGLSEPFSAVASGQVGDSDPLDESAVRAPAVNPTQKKARPVRNGTPARTSSATVHVAPRVSAPTYQRPRIGGTASPSGPPKQGPTRTAIAKRSATREPIDAGTVVPPSPQADSSTPRLALALPSSSPTRSLVHRNELETPLGSGALKTTSRDWTTMAWSVGLFLFFFTGFGILHIKVVRFLSRSTRRKTS